MLGRSFRRRSRSVLFIISICLMMNMAAHCVLAVNDIQDVQNELDRQPETAAEGNNLWWEFFKLIVILGLLIFAAWSVVKMLSKNLNTRAQGTWLHVVDEVVMGQNRGIALCEVGGKLYAVGVTDHSITLLFEVNHPELLEQISQEEAQMAESKSRQPELNKLLGSLLSLKSKNIIPSGKKKNFHELMTEQNNQLYDLMKKNQESGNSEEKRR